METIQYSEEMLTRRKTKKMLLYVSIFSIVMLFAGLTSAYVISQADGVWVDIRMPNSFYLSTAIILASSVTIWMALRAARNNRPGEVKSFVLLTLLFGIAFSICQYLGWSELFRRGHTFRSEYVYMIKGEYGKDYTYYYKGAPVISENGEYYEQSDVKRERPLRDKILGSRDVGSSYLVIITFLHFLHLLGGLIYVAVVYGEARKMLYTPGNTLRLELCNTYWHFLDVLWVYLFLFLLFIH